MSEYLMRSNYPVLCDLCGIHIEAGEEYRHEGTFNFHLSGKCPNFGGNKDRLIDQLSEANESLKQQLADKSVDLQMKSSIVVQLQQQLADTQKQLAESMAVGECEWKYAGAHDDDYYETSCNEAHCFTDGNVKDNHYIYCPYCGKKIKEAK